MSITVLLLIALCLLCVVVFLKHNRQKETFFQETCDNEITCPSGTSLHIVNLGTPQEQKACCPNQVNGNGYYLSNNLLNNQCVQCTALSNTENENYLNSFTTTELTPGNKNLFQSSNNSTIATCRAECKNGSDYAPHKAAVEGDGWNQVGAQESSYDTSKCGLSFAYSNVYSNVYLNPQTSPYSNLTVRYQTADTHAPNYENSWCSNNSYNNNNSNYYCCTDSNIPRYNSNALYGLGCCASNEYLSNDGSCSSCPNGGLCSNDLNQSGILCCQISNCMLCNSPNSTSCPPRHALWSVGNTYYSNNIAVRNINNYGCYAHYKYNQLSTITNGSNIVSLSNTIYFDGSNYNYLDDDQNTTLNNIIGSTNIRTSNELNWFYHHDSNHNTIETNIDIDIPERIYSDTTTDYSRYYKCDANKFLRCTSDYASDSTPNCRCCSSNEYFNEDEDEGNCSNIASSTVYEIANNQLYKVNLDECLAGYGKSNFDGLNGTSNQCTKCSNLVYYNNSAKNNTCLACPDGQYPNGMDAEGALNTDCSNAPSLTLKEDWYRFKYIASPTYYLTYTSNESNYSIFNKVTDSNFRYKDYSNIYLWSNDTDKVKIQLPKTINETTNESGKFLYIDSSFTLSSGHYNPAAEFKPIPYCEPGEYASNLECALCASNSYNSSYGAEVCTDCPLYSFTHNQTGRTDESSCMCPAGYYYNTSASPSQCVECPQNKWCPGGSITGEGLSNYDCPSNSSSRSKASKDRDCICDAGYIGPNGGPCEICSAGTHSSTGASSCTPCRPGTYSSSNGASSCTPCTAGTYSSNHGASNCTPCTAGKYSSDNGASNCTPCTRGTYSSTPGASTCPPCSNNTYSSTPGASTCTQCHDNSSPNSNNTACLCDAGYAFYQPESTWFCSGAGNDAYSPALDNNKYPCPSNSSTNSYTASSINECKCIAGYHGPPGADCTECPKDYYCAGESNIQRCPDSMSSPVKSTSSNACECIEGSFVGDSRDSGDEIAWCRAAGSSKAHGKCTTKAICCDCRPYSGWFSGRCVDQSEDFVKDFEGCPYP